MVMTHLSLNPQPGNWGILLRQSGKNMCQGSKPDTGKLHSPYIGMNVRGSTYENGCTYNGMCTAAVD